MFFLLVVVAFFSGRYAQNRRPNSSSFRALSATRWWGRGIIAHPGVDHSLWSLKSGPTRQHSTYSEMADSHMKQRRTHQNHDKKTAHGQLLFFFFCQLIIHLSSMYFLPRKFMCVRVDRTKSHRPTRAGHVRMGLPLTSLWFSTTTGTEGTVPERAPTLRLSSCGL